MPSPLAGTDTPWLLYVSALMAAGLASGFAGGLFGIGGGILRVPIFLYLFPFFGVHPSVVMHMAAGTSLALAVPTALVSADRHRREGNLDSAFLRTWIPALLAGVLVGTVAARVAPGHALAGAFAVVLFLVAVEMILAPDDFHLAEHVPTGPGRWVLASAIGGLSTLLGLSGGAFTTPILVTCRYPMHRAIAVSAASATMIAVLGTVGAIVNGADIPGRPAYSVGYVDLQAVVALLPTVAVTAPLGVRVAARLDAARLRRVFGVFLAFVATDMASRFLWG
jgi:uncharacterized membrane protein YfcA